VLCSVIVSLSLTVSGCFTVGTIRTLRHCVGQGPTAVLSGVGTASATAAWTIVCNAVGAGINYVPERSGTLTLPAPAGCAAPTLYVLGTAGDLPVCSGETIAVTEDGPVTLPLVDPGAASAVAQTLQGDSCALLLVAQQGRDAEIVALAGDGRIETADRVHASVGGWFALPVAVFIDAALIPFFAVGGLIAGVHWLATGRVVDDEPRAAR
jgi:hypothetical protein